MTGLVTKRRSCAPYAQLNKNFGHWPFARDAHMANMEFTQSRKGHHFCWVSDKIKFTTHMPKLVHVPNVFDLKVALNVLRLAVLSYKEKGTRAFWMPTARKFLHDIGVAYSGDKAAELKRSLVMWQHLRIHYSSWKTVGSSERKPHRLPPLIKINDDGRTFISEEWFDTTKGYYMKVPLDLPSNKSPSTVNFLLLMLAMNPGETNTYSNNVICAKIGLEHSHKIKSLNGTIGTVTDWFASNDGLLVTGTIGRNKEQLQFTVTLPAVGEVRDTFTKSSKMRKAQKWTEPETPQEGFLAPKGKVPAKTEQSRIRRRKQEPENDPTYDYENHRYYDADDGFSGNEVYERE